MSARLNELDAAIAALKSQLAQNPDDAALRTQLDATLAEYEALSVRMGGDRAAAVGPLSEEPIFLNSVPPAPANCTATTTTFTDNTPVAIPTGPAVVTSQIVVSGTGPFLWDLDLQTFITHTMASDLDITLQSPAGTVITITTDNGAGNDDVFNGTLWDDDANPAGQVPYVTNAGLVTDHPYVDATLASPLVPEEALAAFNGEDPNGTWTITISDDLASEGGSLNSWSLMVSTFPSAPTTAMSSFTNNTPLTIPTGPAVVSAQLLVSGAGTVLCDLNLTTFLTHTFSADLDITLQSPAGTVVTLTTDNGAGNDNNFNGTLWDDDANPAGQVPYTTNNGLATDHAYVNLTTATPLEPEESFGAFIGEDPNGTWTITISDDLAGDGGTLSSWTLDLTTCSCAAACTITCPSNITTSNDPNQCGAVVNYAAPMTTGSCGTVTCTPPSGSFFPVGTTPVNCTTTAGPSCSFTVTVNDTQPPSITCPPNVTAQITNPGGSCGVVNFPAPTASDNCPGLTVACTPPSGACFPAGITTVTCTATDSSGNTATCSFTVSVTLFNICIQDNTTRKILRFSTATGDFLFNDCSKGISATGTGTVAVNFCKTTLMSSGSKTSPGSPTVNAVANTCTGAASATIQLNGVTHTLNDSNMANNTCGCL